MSLAELQIHRLPSSPVFSPERISNWEQPPWCQVPAVSLQHHLGAAPEHRPLTEARLGWDDDALYAIFQVQDQYVTAVASAHQDAVCRDSCVEWFFAPSEAAGAGYYNVEINCGGRVLLHYQEQPRSGSFSPATPRALEDMSIDRTLPSTVSPEILEPVTWGVEYRLPFSVLESCGPIVRPTAGTVWRGNLYKCADDSSHPHWLSWAPVDCTEPDFHVPESFGRLVFA